MKVYSNLSRTRYLHVKENLSDKVLPYIWWVSSSPTELLRVPDYVFGEGRDLATINTYPILVADSSTEIDPELLWE